MENGHHVSEESKANVVYIFLVFVSFVVYACMYPPYYTLFSLYWSLIRVYFFRNPRVQVLLRSLGQNLIASSGDPLLNVNMSVLIEIMIFFICPYLLFFFNF